MKLVYLWFENYKNFEQLNLSLHSNYEEDESPVLKKNKLTIKLNKLDKINIFGDKFNIKTIVGVNGSGKTNLSNIICSILRTERNRDFEDYFINVRPKKYCLIYKENGEYKKISNCNVVTLYVNKKKCILKNGENSNCALFKPFLNIEEDIIPTFPQDLLYNKITDKKLENYFYYDRFRIYDTSHTLKDLFELNKTKKFEIFANKNKYLLFKDFGYELNIVQEFEWLNRQLKRNILYYFKNYNIDFTDKYTLVDILIESNNSIINIAKTRGYFDCKKLIDEVISNGCFSFLLIKIGEFFSYLEGCENVISLRRLKNVIKTFVEFTYTDQFQYKLLNLNQIDFRKKHKELLDFYKEIQKEFKQRILDKSIVEQFRKNNFLLDFSELLNALIIFEKRAYNNIQSIEDILEIVDENYFRIKSKYFNSAIIPIATTESFFINAIGIFRMNYYHNKNGKIYSFLDLSTGEQRLLRLFADILSLRDKDVNVLIFDEMDLSWHPEWQRKMVYYIIDFVEKIFENDINIIFTTHSPLILSDMPSNNVLMLTKEPDGTSKICKSNNTFCSNINDLFNDNFFIDTCNGICTIGEFAKHYIEKIQTKINSISNESDFNLIQEEINIIGEPIIRNCLMKELVKNNPPQDDIYIKYQQLIQEYNKLKEKFNEKNQH